MLVCVEFIAVILSKFRRNISKNKARWMLEDNLAHSKTNDSRVFVSFV